MSSRVGVDKVNYLCANGHITRQRADKKAPKRCAAHGCGLRPIVDEPEFAQDISAEDYSDRIEVGILKTNPLYPNGQDPVTGLGLPNKSETAHIGGLPVKRKRKVIKAAEKKKKTTTKKKVVKRGK